MRGNSEEGLVFHGPNGEMAKVRRKDLFNRIYEDGVLKFVEVD